MTTPSNAGNPGVRAFYPFYGMVAGATISFIAMRYVDESDLSEVVLLGRIHALITAMIFWGLGAAWLQGKELYGGGAIASGEDKRNVHVGFPLVAIWAISLIAFVAKDLFLVWVLSLVLVGAFLGEVGWRDPLAFVKTIYRYLGGR